LGFRHKPKCRPRFQLHARPRILYRDSL
jgi:hypothetical protein